MLCVCVLALCLQGAEGVAKLPATETPTFAELSDLRGRSRHIAVITCVPLRHIAQQNEIGIGRGRCIAGRGKGGAHTTRADDATLSPCAVPNSRHAERGVVLTVGAWALRSAGRHRCRG